jgi:Aspartyl protease
MPIPIGLQRALLALLLVPVTSLSVTAQSATPIPELDNTVHSAHLDIEFGKPFVNVMVNGKGPFRFIIDTGTGGDALVTPALASQLGLPVVGHAVLSDPSGVGGKRTPIVVMDTLEIAGITFTGVHALNDNFFIDNSTCDGVLGFKLFRDFLLTLDFPNRALILSEGRLLPDGGKSVLPFRMPYGVPIAMLRVDGLQPVEAQLDSGGGGLVIPSQLAARLKYDVDPILFANGRSVSTRFELKAGKLASNVKIGRYTFVHPVVEIHPAFPLINFGSPPMQIFAITFDQKNLLVRFAASRQRFSLSAPPSLQRFTNAPSPDPPPTNLVPVG